MESFGRRDFVGWRGTKSDAVQAPSAFRDPARAQKTKSKRLQFHLSSAGVSSTGLTVFSAPAASKSSHDIHIALRCSPCRNEKSSPPNCFHLNEKGS
jgi:hypothetical protein